MRELIKYLGESKSFTLTKSMILTIALILFFAGYYFAFPFIQIRGKYIRLADFSFLFLLPCFIFYYRHLKDTYIKNIFRFFCWISAYGFLVTTINYFLGLTNYIGFIYLIKEIQYFITGFLVYVFIINRKNHKLLLIILSFLILSNTFWGIYQIISGLLYGYYGIASIGYEGAAAASGAVYLSCLIFSFCSYILSKNFKIFFLILFFLSLVCLLLVGSRTPVISGFIFCLLFIVMKFCRHISKAKVIFPKKLLALAILTFLVVVTFLRNLYVKIYDFLFSADNLFNFWNRINRLEEGTEIRTGKIMRYIDFSFSQIYGMIFGYGKGVNEAFSSSGNLSVDSQAARYLIELGLMGIICWFLFFIYTIFLSLKLTKEDTYKFSLLFISFTLSFLVMFYSYDVMIIANFAFIYWVCIFSFFGFIRLVKQKI